MTDSSNRIDRKVLRAISSQISDLLDSGTEVIVVTSGAIGAGLGVLSRYKRNCSLAQLQAIASIGQTLLMDTYNGYLKKRGYIGGQILLTQEDFNDRKRYLNIKYTINELIAAGAVPLINENDSISTEEIKCGDNDRLSSLVADATGSDLLVLLTDVEGLLDNSGRLIREVDRVDKGIMEFCRQKECDVSTGGMRSKLEAVCNATGAGIETVIAGGRVENVLTDLCGGRKAGTRFAPLAVKMRARKRWIAYGTRPRGEIMIDAGAVRALVEKKRSLLPSGVTGFSGKFKQGDIVDILGPEGSRVARGLTNYTSVEISKIKGKRTDRIEKELGYKDYDEVVHRDNLVLSGSKEEEEG